MLYTCLREYADIRKLCPPTKVHKLLRKSGDVIDIWGSVVSARIYQPSCKAMRLSVKVVTISVTIGSPAALIVRRASNISSSSLTSQIAIVERPWMHCTSEGLSNRNVRQ